MCKTRSLYSLFNLTRRKCVSKISMTKDKIKLRLTIYALKESCNVRVSDGAARGSGSANSGGSARFSRPQKRKGKRRHEKWRQQKGKRYHEKKRKWKGKRRNYRCPSPHLYFLLYSFVTFLIPFLHSCKHSPGVFFLKGDGSFERNLEFVSANLILHI